MDSIKFIESDLEPDMQDWAEASVTHIQNVKDSGTYWYQVTAPNYTPKIGYFTVTISPRDLTLSNNMQDVYKRQDVARLADVLGHSSIETTRIYLISTGAEHAKTLEQLRLVS